MRQAFKSSDIISQGKWKSSQVKSKKTRIGLDKFGDVHDTIS